MITLSNNERFRFCDEFPDAMCCRSVRQLRLWSTWTDRSVREPNRRPKKPRHKSLINIFLGGGPPHQDMWGFKPTLRKKFGVSSRPIDTKVPGIQICEVFPRIASVTDKCVMVRSVVGRRSTRRLSVHDRLARNLALDRWSPQHRSGRVESCKVRSIARSRRSWRLAAKTQHVPWSDPGGPGFLGAAVPSLQTRGPGMADMMLNCARSMDSAVRSQVVARVPRSPQARGRRRARCGDGCVQSRRLSTC